MKTLQEANIAWLDDPEVFQVNRLKAHSDHFFFVSEEDAKTCTSVLSQSLNGMWKFSYAENASLRPASFYRTDFDASGFDEIRVPGHIELAGYDKIHYINTMYPWEGHDYRRPAYSLKQHGNGAGMFSRADYNPVGSYIRYFDLDEALKGKRVYVCFEGVEQAMYVWLNGAFIGYAEDSFTPSEFDLTPYIKEQGNVLAVEVHKRSTAAYLEDQDFFRFFGIFRDVTLKAKPRLHVEDMWIKPGLSEQEEGSLEVALRISKAGEGGLTVQCELSDGQGQRLYAKRLPVADNGGADEYTIRLEREALGRVIPWNNEAPYLYTLTVRLFDEQGQLAEYVPYPVGFRRIEILDKIIYLNGKRLIIHGVNRHEWNARTGRCIQLKDMVQDVETCRKNHINAVRTCHYPDQIPWYYLCDQNGIYLMAETNLESHGTWQKMGAVEPSYNVPGSLPEWRGAVLDRAESNFELFKNHASVLFWSLGNEPYAGDNIAAMNAYFKGKQDGRLVHYEGVCQNRAYEDVISDVESRMYARPEEIRAYLSDRPKKPYLLCEYMHDQGNSLGGLYSYIRLLDEFPMYQGGFIWDFIDQALFVKDEITGREVLRYGGDFDDRPSDYEYSGDGILFADRTEKPAMQEVRYYYGLHK